MKQPQITIDNRKISQEHKPLVIAEIGINHEGSLQKALTMIDDAYEAGCECVKFQCHILEDEMTEEAKNVIPGNAQESIWDIMERCLLSEEEEYQIKSYVEDKGMIFLSTPFSRAAADRLEEMNVSAYKIGSGECNNYPLVKHIAQKGKPVILSTGMNDLASIAPAVKIFRDHQTPYALLHCTSLYPTPYDNVRLQAISQIQETFKDAVLGLSDHSLGIYTCLGAIPLGACILEKHFTSDKKWPGPDINISLDPRELKELVHGSEAVFKALKGDKVILKEEQPTIDFAYASVVSLTPIARGEKLSLKNLWVKRPGTGEFLSKDFSRLIGLEAACDISSGQQITKKMVKW